ncbi:RNA-splicing ligase RtcB [candidate division WOR-3 bacterium]|uniref:tRNA-splicing ligase RtcB n=1 Tax=candidate division WOR-3 bacterium TaxID=2052148 RepID=A0A9D5K8M8_UNCW3|nr:RNA-splicing ligase RtcB [candidate division WOR-3 bacterium]MBD3364488.1 RNA-splicing ligase RtcB [candidate division WOR-3 bacterium]
MANQPYSGKLEKIDSNRWRIPRKGGMKTDGIIFSSEKLLPILLKDNAPQQVENVAHLPGIVGSAMAMPDIHWGYGFPIGGVAAFDVDEGVISPGGVGYDINCGVRLMRTNLDAGDVKQKLRTLMQEIFTAVPAGVGKKGRIRISRQELKNVLLNGARWAVNKGYGWDEDLDHTEEESTLAGADPAAVSERAFERGLPQIGTLGAGNHFLEIQVVDEIFDNVAADVMGLRKGQVVVMIHTGSRGFGYQVCDDAVKSLGKAVHKYHLSIPDRQLACAPIKSPEGKAYFGAMAGAANYAWANRQAIMHWVREGFEKTFGKGAEMLGLHLVYDVAHNIAKFEEHEVGGKIRKLCVHRKGATRAFGPGHPDIPDDYADIGQPVIIPGDMGTASYVLVGTDKGMEISFGSTCHGAGRVWSRSKALKQIRGHEVKSRLEREGILVLSASAKTLAEETPEAYKDIDEVVEVAHNAGLSRKVARMRPLGVIKG